jgi:hypothetical protein
VEGTFTAVYPRKFKRPSIAGRLRKRENLFSEPPGD